MNHLIETATGALLSSTILSIPTPGIGRSVVVRPDGEQNHATWNPATKVFDPLPEVYPIGKLTFLELFTDLELQAIVGSNDSRVRVFIKKLEMAGSVDLKSSRMVAAVDGLETLGLIGSGRAAEILNV